MTAVLKLRARDIGLPLSGTPGSHNAITDVAGVTVGYATLDESVPRPGRKRLVRTGVTAILPRPVPDVASPVYAGIHRFNGNGEMTGSHWIEDGGHFTGPVLITNTHSVGIAHHAAIRWMIDRCPDVYGQGDVWLMPVVAETWDGLLNDVDGQHITEADVRAALDGALGGAIAEGNVGGGTGMIAYGYKGGTGTASRLLDVAGQTHTVGILVQANHGIRDWLTVCGIPFGRRERAMTDPPAAERGSIIVVVATDAPMMPHQLKRLARRASIGIGRGGTPGGNNSGDLFLAFSTANRFATPSRAPARLAVEMLKDDVFDAFYMAVADGVEEAVLNAMVAAEESGGTAFDRIRVPALDGPAVAAAVAAARRR